MMIGGRNMTPPKAIAAMEDLISLAKAVESKTLEADTKAFLSAAKKAEAAEATAAAAGALLSERETALGKREKSCLSRNQTLTKDREAFSRERGAWKAEKEAQEQTLNDGNVRLANATAAVKERESRATAKLAEAQTAIEAAQKVAADGKRLKSKFEAKLKKIAEI